MTCSEKKARQYFVDSALQTAVLYSDGGERPLDPPLIYTSYASCGKSEPSPLTAKYIAYGRGRKKYKK